MPALLNYSPVAVLRVGAVELHVWGLCVATGILVATAMAARRAHQDGISSSEIWRLAFPTVIAGLLGARALYVLEYWQEFVESPLTVFAVWQGGLSAWGAILAGVGVAWKVMKRWRMDAAKVTAALAPALLLGDAIGRLGGGASHMYPGTPTSFPLSFMLDGVQRHEVGIELSLASLLGFLVISALERKRMRELGVGSKEWEVHGSSVPTPNTLLPTPVFVLLWYSAERFLLDFFRATDLPGSDLRYGGLTLAQWLAVLGGLSAAFLLFRSATRTRAIVGEQ